MRRQLLDTKTLLVSYYPRHHLYMFTSYLLCLPVSPVNACHYDVTRLCPIAIDYYIFHVLLVYTNQNYKWASTQQKGKKLKNNQSTL